MCNCKSYSFSVIVSVEGEHADYGSTHLAAAYLRDRLEDAQKELAENAENDALEPRNYRVTTSEPTAADRAECLAGVCER